MSRSRRNNKRAKLGRPPAPQRVDGDAAVASGPQSRLEEARQLYARRVDTPPSGDTAPDPDPVVSGAVAAGEAAVDLVLAGEPEPPLVAPGGPRPAARVAVTLPSARAPYPPPPAPGGRALDRGLSFADLLAAHRAAAVLAGLPDDTIVPPPALPAVWSPAPELVAAR